MRIDEFMNHIEKKLGIRVCSESEALSIIQCSIKIIDPNHIKGVNGIHYMWSKGFDLSSFLSMNRFRHLNEENCRIFLEDILNKDAYYLIVDDCCLQGLGRPLCLLSNTSELITTISELHWELYEIYILDISLEWLISFNHVSEVMLYGDASNSECIKIKEYIMHKFKWAISSL